MPTSHNKLLAFATISLTLHGALALAPWSVINRAAEPAEDSSDTLVVSFADRITFPIAQTAPAQSERNKETGSETVKSRRAITDTSADILRDSTNQIEPPGSPATVEQTEADIQTADEQDSIIYEPVRESSAPATISSRPGQTPISAAAGDETATEATRNRLQVFLIEALGEHFHYPRLAQRHGWQGEVTLALRVEADGQLSHVRVTQSSGYAILDEAATTALEKIARLEQAAAWLHGAHFDMVLPVRYQLVDG
jgi:TonB family protein